MSHRELPRLRVLRARLQATPELAARLGLAAMTLSLEAFLKSIADELAAGDRQMAVRFSAWCTVEDSGLSRGGSDDRVQKEQ